MRSELPHRQRESASVVSTAPLSETATDPNGGIDALVKKNILTSDDVDCIQDPEQSQRVTTLTVSKTRSRANVDDLTRVQSVKIGNNRQHVHKAREGNVASGDATSASMIRTRVGFVFVTRVPWISITLQHVSTRCGRWDSNDGSLLWTKRHRLGWRRRMETPWDSTLHQPRMQDVDLELCVHLMTLQTGRLSTAVDLPHSTVRSLADHQQGGRKRAGSTTARKSSCSKMVGHE